MTYQSPLSKGGGLYQSPLGRGDLIRDLADREAGSRELPIHGESKIGLHGGYAPKKETERWASFSHFRILQIGE